MSVATWTGNCTRCHRENVKVCSRRTHGERVLCGDCAATPYTIPPASGPEAPPATGNEMAAREPATSNDRPRASARGDTANARRFVHEHGARLRHVAQRRRWLRWGGWRWVDDATGDADRGAKQTARNLLREAAAVENEQARKDALKWAVTSQNEPRIRAMLTLAATEPELVVSADDLDTATYLLACPNGTVDLRTGNLRAPSAADLITRGTTVRYEPAAECPRWERTLGEVFDGDDDLIAFFQRWAGYSLTGDTGEHVIAVLHGAGCNGKTTIVETIKRLAGDLAVTAAFDTFARARGDRGPRNDLARLAGARIVVGSESGEGRRLDEATLKEITGGDRIAARFLYGEHFEFRPAFKLWLVTNHLPRVDGDDNAIWRRLRLIPFDVSFEGREDRTLIAQLERELPGILAWAVRGCLDWQHHGLGQASAVEHATRAYRQDEDLLGAFLAERCGTGGEAPARDLRAAFDAWAAECGERSMSGAALGKRLAKRGIHAVRRAKGQRVYIGIHLDRVTGDGR